jgi:ABC-type transport system involved in multi-copper enzyme maturation permease subunit
VNRLDTWRFRWHLARAVQRRGLRAAIYRIGPYATLSAAISLAAAVLRNHVKSVQDSGFVVLSNPLVTPLFGAAILSSVYLAVVSTRTICREREQGTLEVLFYGPMDTAAYLLGKYLTHMSVYSLMVAGYLIALALYALVTNFCFDLNLLWVSLLSAATTSAVMMLGILLSTLNRSAGRATFALLAVVLTLLGVQLGYDHLPISLQTAFTWLKRTVNWLSPFAHLERGIDALLRGSIAEYWLMMGLSWLYTAIAFGLAVRTMRRRGVR